MATDFSSSKKTVNRDLTSVVYKEYMQGEWGVEVGYNTVPGWYAYMRKSQLEWLEEQDCADGLNAIANQVFAVPCPAPWTFVAATATQPAYCSNGCPPGQKPITIMGQTTCIACFPESPCIGPAPYLAPNILTVTPIPGINPFPSIHCKDRCKIAKIPLCSTALIFEFSSRDYNHCN